MGIKVVKNIVERISKKRGWRRGEQPKNRSKCGPKNYPKKVTDIMIEKIREASVQKIGEKQLKNLRKVVEKKLKEGEKWLENL